MTLLLLLAQPAVAVEFTATFTATGEVEATGTLPRYTGE